MIPLLFQTFREWREFQDLDPRLQGPFICLALAFYREYGFPLLLTCVLRTPAENAKEQGLPDSGHLNIKGPVRAIDIRILPVDTYPGLNDAQRQWLIDYWYRHFRFGSYWSALVHRGNHIHVQCPERAAKA